MTLPNLLLAFATFRQKVQPDWFAHIHSHGHASARLARCFGAACTQSISKSHLDQIEFGAYMHDIGKYLIPKEILFKSGPLLEEEREIMALHPVHGVEILRNLPYITPTIAQTVLYHHERWDGRGYPEGLAGTAIPFAARLFSVVDIYTSLRAKRSYKASLTRSGACALMRNMAGVELDPRLVYDFIRLVEGHRRMRFTRPAASDGNAYSSLIRKTLRVVL